MEHAAARIYSKRVCFFGGLMISPETEARLAVPCTEFVPNKFRLDAHGIAYDPMVEAFATHERNMSVGFVNFTKNFKYIDPHTGRLKSAKGITKILKGAFYDDYTPAYRQGEKKRCASAPARGKRKRSSRLTAHQRLKAQISDTRLAGVELGKTVHQELCDWARTPREDEWRRRHPAPNMYTVKVIRALNMLRIEPLYGECPIFANWGIATGIDMVGASAKYGGRLVLIEIKTGYEGYFNRGSGTMTRTPLKRVSNSPLNQAFLQCLTARAILDNEYGIRGTIGIVIRVHSRGVNVHTIPDEFIRRQNAIYRGLQQYVQDLKFSPRTAAATKQGPRGRGKQRKPAPLPRFC